MDAVDAEKYEAILHSARELYACRPNWVIFYRQILGLGGAARRVLPSPAEQAEFERSAAYLEIQAMLSNLRKQKVAEPPVEEEPTRVITVRIPKSLHEALRVEAFECRTSMNKLCISKLLQFIDSQHVPAEVEAVE